MKKAGTALAVLIIDDSLVYRKMFAEAARQTGLAGRVQTVADGYKALELLAAQPYDVVLLDVFMPGINGLVTMDIISGRYPELPVIMTSSGTRLGVDLTIQAMERGAVDFFVKPGEPTAQRNMQLITEYLESIFMQLIRKAAIRYSKPRSGGEIPSSRIVNQVNEAAWKRRGADLVVIASSTGGPGALRSVVSGFNGQLHKPLLIVQHMSAGFTRSLADNLNKECALEVREASHNEEIKRGVVFLAPGSIHMTLGRSESGQMRIKLLDSPFVNGVKPSADVLFDSVARFYQGGNILAVILTGMGVDGTEGVRAMKSACNCYCISQNEATSVVYGMPRSVHEAGLSDEVMALDAIGPRINRLAGG